MGRSAWIPTKVVASRLRAGVPFEVTYFLLGPGLAEQFPGMVGSRGQGSDSTPPLIRLPTVKYMFTESLYFVRWHIETSVSLDAGVVHGLFGLYGSSLVTQSIEHLIIENCVFHIDSFDKYLLSMPAGLRPAGTHLELNKLGLLLVAVKENAHHREPEASQ